MTRLSTKVQAFLVNHHVPLSLWVAPRAHETIGEVLDQEFPTVSRMVTPGREAEGAAMEGPAIILLVPRDLTGPNRAFLLDLCQRAQPGRPILIGGTRDKSTLLDAIENFHICRVLDERGEEGLLADAVRKAHAHVQAEVALQRATWSLQQETRKLSLAVREIQATQERLLQSERLTTLGRMTRGLIEFIREHQGPLDSFESTARSVVTTPPMMRLLDHAFEGIRTVATLLDEICAYSEDRELKYQKQDELIDPLVESAVALCRLDRDMDARVLRTDLSSSAWVLVDRYRFYHIMINLLRNAQQATRNGDRIEVRTRREGASVAIEVMDTGSGMTEEVKSRIFEPFFSTKGEHGMGLGLQITKLVLERHGGTIECTSEPGKGSTFVLRLPAIR